VVVEAEVNERTTSLLRVKGEVWLKKIMNAQKKTQKTLTWPTLLEMSGKPTTQASAIASVLP